tara:strand:- start:1103 stop:1606 length:504 start_codon:yes stop_codon:yes gene_type:complete
VFYFASEDCIGIEITDNRIIGPVSDLTGGPAQIEFLKNNSVEPTGDIMRPKPKHRSIFEWQHNPGFNRDTIAGGWSKLPLGNRSGNLVNQHLFHCIHHSDTFWPTHGINCQADLDHTSGMSFGNFRSDCYDGLRWHEHFGFDVRTIWVGDNESGRGEEHADSEGEKE